MPLTANERKKRFRDKLKTDPAALALQKEKDRARKDEKRRNMTDDEKNKVREINRKNAARYRNKKAIEKNSTIMKPPCVCPFVTAQSMGKAKKKVKEALPKSPRKRKAVLQAVACEEGLHITPLQSTSASGNRGIDAKTKKMVIKFYIENSWTCPGMKDTVINREKEEKNYVLSF